MERVDGRGIGEMDIVENNEKWCLRGKVAEQYGEALEEARARRLMVRSGTVDGRNTPQQAREVIEMTTAQLRELGAGKTAEVGLQSLRPQPERGRCAERMGARGEGDRRGPTGLQYLNGQSRLPDPGITLQEHTSELAGHCAVPLGLEIGDLVVPSHDAGLPRHTAAAVEAHLDLIRSRGGLCSPRTMPGAGPLPGGRLERITTQP
jgi:hypothetical protein